MFLYTASSANSTGSITDCLKKSENKELLDVDGVCFYFIIKTIDCYYLITNVLVNIIIIIICKLYGIIKNKILNFNLW